MARRTGDKNQFWANAATGVAGNSATVELGRSVGQVTLFITVSGATTVKLQAVHPGDITTEGVDPDTADSVWHDVYYVAQPVAVTFAGAGSAAVIVPDSVLSHVRLQSSADVTATAGWLSTPEG